MVVAATAAALNVTDCISLGHNVLIWIGAAGFPRFALLVDLVIESAIGACLAGPFLCGLFTLPTLYDTVGAAVITTSVPRFAVTLRVSDACALFLKDLGTKTLVTRSTLKFRGVLCVESFLAWST